MWRSQSVMKLQDAQRLVPSCKLTKKTLSHILLHAFCLHFLRIQICELTRIERVSPAWKFKLHFTRITDVSPAFCNCQVKKYPPPSKKKNKKTRKNKNKALFKEKKVPGKTSLYQRSLEHLTTLCMTSVYFHFHFFSLSLYHLFFSIVYNRAARLALACFDTPSWWYIL